MNKFALFSTVFLVTTNILFSTTNWYWQYPNPQGNALRDISIINEKTMIAVGEYGTIIRTEDSGENWYILNSPPEFTFDIVSVYFLNDNKGWVVGPRDKILKTENGGKSWSYVRTGTYDRWRSVFFLDQNNGYIVWDWNSAIISKTSDGGKTRESLDCPFLNQNDCLYNSFYSIFALNNKLWVVGSRGIIESDDNGINWYEVASSTYQQLRSIFMVSENTGWIAGYKGTILHTKPRPEYITSIQASEKLVERDPLLFRNYPNPFNPSTSIEFFLEKNGNVEIDIYNILGQRVSQLLSSRLERGKYIVKWNARNHPSGIYFCSLVTSEFQKRIKVILLK